MRSTRFAWKLYTGYAVLLFGSIVLVCLVVNWGMSREIWQEASHGLHQQAILLQDMARTVLREPDNTALQQRLHQLGVLLQMRFTVIRADGTVTADSAEDPTRMDNHAERPEVLAARTQGHGLAVRASHTIGERMLYLA